MNLRKTLGNALSCVLIRFIRKTLGYALRCVLIRFIESLVDRVMKKMFGIYRNICSSTSCSEYKFQASVLDAE